jgi:4-hydroxy-3-methylbut-2-enyl diphosphate reductase
VDHAGEIDERWLEGVTTVGLTSGASVPEILVDEVIAFLRSRGFGELEEVTTAEESLIFALPPELRRDMKASARTSPA